MRRSATVAIVAGLVVDALFAATACSSGGEAGPDITIVDAFMTPGEDTLAVYLTISNDGGEDDITDAAAPGDAQRVTLHQSVDRNGLSVMEPAEEIDVAAGSTTALDPGKAHLMLEGLTRPYEVGDELQLDVTFAKSGTIRTIVQVIEADEALDRLVEGQ